MGAAAVQTLATTIGGRIRRERQARGWTLDGLAEAAGVSRRQIVNLEQGVVNPSIGVLLSISDALGIGLSALVEPPSSRLVTLTRAGEGAALWTGVHGGRGVLVAGTGSPDVVELWEWILFPGDRRESTPHQHGSRELLHIHEGAVTLAVADESFELASGDAITFPGDVPHAYANDGSERARFSLSVYEPHVGAARKRMDTND